MKNPITGIYFTSIIVFGLINLFGETARIAWERDQKALTCGVKGCQGKNDLYWKKQINGEWKTIAKRIWNDTIEFPLSDFHWKPPEIDLIDKGTLDIKSVSLNRHNGTYICICLSDKHTVDLHVCVPIRSLDISGPPMPVKENSAVEFTCRAEGGQPVPSITWDCPAKRHNIVGKPHDVTSQIQFNVTRDMHNRPIRCRAALCGTDFSNETTLNIKYKPNVTIEATTATPQLGDTVNIICSVDSSPKATVTLMHDETIHETANTIPSGGNPRNATKYEYVISDFDQSREGSYTCSANNSEGTVKRDIKLTLIGSSHFETWIIGGAGTTLALLLVGIWLCYRICKQNLQISGRQVARTEHTETESGHIVRECTEPSTPSGVVQTDLQRFMGLGRHLDRPNRTPTYFP